MYDTISLQEIHFHANIGWVVLLLVIFLDPYILVKFIGSNLNQFFELLKNVNLESHRNTKFILLDLICKKMCKFISIFQLQLTEMCKF